MRAADAQSREKNGRRGVRDGEKTGADGKNRMRQKKGQLCNDREDALECVNISVDTSVSVRTAVAS